MGNRSWAPSSARRRRRPRTSSSLAAAACSSSSGVSGTRLDASPGGTAGPAEGPGCAGCCCCGGWAAAGGAASSAAARRAVNAARPVGAWNGGAPASAPAWMQCTSIGAGWAVTHSPTKAGTRRSDLRVPLPPPGCCAPHCVTSCRLRAACLAQGCASPGWAPGGARQMASSLIAKPTLQADAGQIAQCEWWQAQIARASPSARHCSLALQRAERPPPVPPPPLISTLESRQCLTGGGAAAA